MAPQQAPSAPESTASPGNEPSVPAQILSQVRRLLRCWSARLPPEADNPAAPIPPSLDGEATIAPVALLENLIEGFRLYRSDAWLQYVTSPATVWGQWVGGELDLPTYEVAKVTFSSARLRLRRETPFGPEEIVAFLTGLAETEEAGKLPEKTGDQLRSKVVDIVCSALRQVGAANEPDGLLERLDRYYHGEQSRAVAVRRQTAFQQPPPPGLLACLAQFLSPSAVLAEGCLTTSYEVRLFHHAPELAAPYLPRERFERAAAGILALRAGLKPQAAPAITLRQVCERLEELGAFARDVQPVLAGPAAGPHRDWIRPLLENFLRLGEVAMLVLGGPTASPVVPQPTTLETVPEPPPAEEPAPAPAPATPVPEIPAPVLSPEDAAVVALAATEPAAEQFRTISCLTDGLLEAVKERWPEAEDALKGLTYPSNRFRQKLLRVVQAAVTERSRLLAEAARQLADELVNKIRRFDALLPGVATTPLPFKGPARLNPEEKETLGRQLKALRDRLLAFMRAHGGYDEYPVAIGESVRKHGLALDNVSYVADARLRADEVVQILEPGYVRRREDGRQELIRSPRVVVAR